MHRLPNILFLFVEKHIAMIVFFMSYFSSIKMVLCLIPADLKVSFT